MIIKKKTKKILLEEPKKKADVKDEVIDYEDLIKKEVVNYSSALFLLNKADEEMRIYLLCYYNQKIEESFFDEDCKKFLKDHVIKSLGTCRTCCSLFGKLKEIVINNYIVNDTSGKEFLTFEIASFLDTLIQFTYDNCISKMAIDNDSRL